MLIPWKEAPEWAKWHTVDRLGHTWWASQPVYIEDLGEYGINYHGGDPRMESRSRKPGVPCRTPRPEENADDPRMIQHTCPFCGNGEDFNELECIQPQHAHAIQCGRCRAEGPEAPTLAEAYQVWNTRPPINFVYHAKDFDDA